VLKSRASWLALFCAIAIGLSAFSAGAAEQGLWEREKLTGDWGGARSALEDRGVVVTLDYIGETLSVLRGGLKRGTSYEAGSTAPSMPISKN
jgi:porin